MMIMIRLIFTSDSPSHAATSLVRNNVVPALIFFGLVSLSYHIDLVDDFTAFKFPSQNIFLNSILSKFYFHSLFLLHLPSLLPRDSSCDEDVDPLGRVRWHGPNRRPWYGSASIVFVLQIPKFASIVFPLITLSQPMPCGLTTSDSLTQSSEKL
jgi:hypothetical protein